MLQIQDSIFYLKFYSSENEMFIFADDTSPRYITSMCILDYDTVAVSDKFGNVTVLRLPPEASSKVEEDLTYGKTFIGNTNKSSIKLEAECNFHIGDVVTSLTKATLQTGSTEVILYSTLGGCLGVLLPISLNEDVDFYQHLEMYLRQEAIPILGRDHLSYRSYYFPCRNIIDGDLCEMFILLKRSVQKTIADAIDKIPAQVIKKIEDIRNKIV